MVTPPLTMAIGLQQRYPRSLGRAIGWGLMSL